MFYKLIHNGMLADLLTDTEYVRYLPRQKRLVMTDSQSANGIMGSDHNTVYHIAGRSYTFDSDVKTVEVTKITEEEYGKLSTEFAMVQQDNKNLRDEMQILKEQSGNQSFMLEAILAKLG